jgi:hypothetical protein
MYTINNREVSLLNMRKIMGREKGRDWIDLVLLYFKELTTVFEE